MDRSSLLIGARHASAAVHESARRPEDLDLRMDPNAGSLKRSATVQLEMRRSAQRKRAAVKKFSFETLQQERRPVGGGRPRPRSATGWSQGLALAALTPRTRQMQAVERLRNGASFRAAVAPPRDELSVAAREFAPTQSVDDVAMEEALPQPVPIRSHKYQGSSSSHELGQQKRPRPLSAAIPARQCRSTQTRPHTAGSRRYDVCEIKFSASVDRRPSTAQRQRIQRYREGKRQVLANKQAVEAQNLQAPSGDNENYLR
jgi:hypothetical protein